MELFHPKKKKKKKEHCKKEKKEKEKRREEKHSIKLKFLFHPLLSMPPFGPWEFASIDLQAFETVQRVRVRVWSIAYLLPFAIENTTSTCRTMNNLWFCTRNVPLTRKGEERNLKIWTEPFDERRIFSFEKFREEVNFHFGLDLDNSDLNFSSKIHVDRDFSESIDLEDFWKKKVVNF